MLLTVRENFDNKAFIKPLLHPYNIKKILIELHIGKKKWLFSCGYNPHKNLINYLLQEPAKGI